MVFFSFFAEYQLYKKLSSHLSKGGGGGVPLYPPPRSTPGIHHYVTASLIYFYISQFRNFTAKYYFRRFGYSIIYKCVVV